ncbi:MAG: tetratricopeptide repeat protein, partial [Bdellovibrionales bacterium]|nr:tetratricopeptide repeat protein [Bdellovibrionales bacterium]
MTLNKFARYFVFAWILFGHLISFPQMAFGQSSGAVAVSAILNQVRTHVRDGKSEAALARLNGDWGKRLTEHDAVSGAAITGLAKGRILEELKRDTEAVEEYKRALIVKSPLETQLNFAIGKLYARLGQDALAREALNRVLKADRGDAPISMRARATLELVSVMDQVATRQETEKKQTAARKTWTEIDKTLRASRRLVRGQDVYPSYLYMLLKARRKMGTMDCRVARDLFARYPAAPEVASWGAILSQNRIDFNTVGEAPRVTCSATVKDIQTRLRRLQLNGQVERSLVEIRDLRARGVFDVWTLDSFEIGALVSNGQNDEAMTILMKHADAHRGRPQFWNLFGRLTSRLGDFAASA